jgi:hypothetical protein
MGAGQVAAEMDMPMVQALAQHMTFEQRAALNDD